MTEYKPGDKVRVRGLVYINDGEVIAAHHNHVWVKYPTGDHELAVLGDVLPWGDPLPTEPGAYADANGTHWVFDGEDWWAASLDEANLPAAPVVALVPEAYARASAVREVIEHYEHMQHHHGYDAHHANARKRFGVER